MTDDETTWLKPAQVNKLRDAAHADRLRNNDRNEAIIALLYDTGLRPTEFVNVTTEMFDAGDRVVRLPSSIQKDYPNDNSPSPATLELDPDDHTQDTVRVVRRYLNARESDTMYLFPTPHSDGMTTRSLRRTVKSVAVEADVRPYVGNVGRGDPDDVKPYTLRHSLAYRWLRACDGYSMYDIKNRLRHRSIQTTEKYYSHFDTV